MKFAGYPPNRVSKPLDISGIKLSQLLRRAKAEMNLLAGPDRTETVFSLSAKNLRGGGCTPPVRARDI